MNARRRRIAASVAERDHARLAFARGSLFEARVWMRRARDEAAPAHVRAEAAIRARAVVCAAELAGEAARPDAPADLLDDAAEAGALVIEAARIEAKLRGSISPRPIEGARERALYLRQRLRIVALDDLSDRDIGHRDIKPANDVERTA